MFTQPTALSFFFACAVTLIGCGRSESNSVSIQGQDMKTKLASREIFPEVTFEPIEFKATKRSQPQSVEDATTAIDAIKNLYNWNNIPAAINKDLTIASVNQYVNRYRTTSTSYETWMGSASPVPTNSLLKRSTTQKSNNSTGWKIACQNKWPTVLKIHGSF